MGIREQPHSFIWPFGVPDMTIEINQVIKKDERLSVPSLRCILLYQLESRAS